MIAGFGRPVAIVIQVHIAEVAAMFRVVPAGLVLGTRSALLPVSVTVGTDGYRSIVVVVETVVVAQP